MKVNELHYIDDVNYKQINGVFSSGQFSVVQFSSGLLFRISDVSGFLLAVNSASLFVSVVFTTVPAFPFLILSASYISVLYSPKLVFCNGFKCSDKVVIILRKTNNQNSQTFPIYRVFCSFQVLG